MNRLLIAHRFVEYYFNEMVNRSKKALQQKQPGSGWLPGCFCI